MAKPQPQRALKKSLKTPIVILSLLCSLSFLLASNKTNIFQTNPASKFAEQALEQNFSHNLLNTQNLFPFCPQNFSDYCPCQDPYRSSLINPRKSFHKERHCPGENETLRCLVPKPEGYQRPYLWPESKDYARFKNVPFPRLIELKKRQNWVRLEGGKLFFPGGGTSFADGVKGYVKEIGRIVPLRNGDIRTALDVGCGVASFAAALTEYDILTMSIAPRDIHEAQVQFALERGLPAMLGVLSIYRLPFPARSFDMAHCSRCLVPWTDHDGLFLLEIDRVLKPGGYWILSGPPINWRAKYKGWERTTEDLENEQNNLENLTRRLCWKKIRENGPISVWQKPTNHIHCAQKIKRWKVPKFCADDVDSDAGWYTKAEACISRLPHVKNITDISGGSLGKWPKRLNLVTPRSKSVGISSTELSEDNKMWKMRVLHYAGVIKTIVNGSFHNIMDMNAGIGGFAAALKKYPVWVMNVVPVDSVNKTLGIIYERGLIGSYMNWCEPFSTYPRTYDLIHADRVFSMYMNKCEIVDILFEMYRILRPHGAVVIRDHIDVIMKVKNYTDQMRWKGKLSHSLEGPLHNEKILFIDNDDI